MVDSGSVNLMGNCVSGESFMEELKYLDFPLESIEENAYEEEEEDWNAKLQSALGPIPFDFLSRCLNENVLNGASDLVLNDSETMNDEGGSELIQPPHLNGETSNTNNPKSVQPLSPNSVLESSNSRIPRRARTKLSRPSIKSKWTSIVPKKYFINKKKRKIPEKKLTSFGANGSTRRCSHCQVTHTPQWREGPMGPKTLCNACGVRYRSGRLFPEYRPMASPEFVPSLHSNSHKKVLEMRNKGNFKTEIVAPLKNGPVFQKENSPPPEFIPMSDYLLDCVLG